MRICRLEFLQQESDYIRKIFGRLGYPSGLLLHLQDRARAIIERSPRSREDTNYVVLPHGTSIQHDILRMSGTKLIGACGTRIYDLTKQKRPPHSHPDSVVYSIPCGKCHRVYVGETGRGPETWLKEHRADFRHHFMSNAMVTHVDIEGHLPD